MARAGRRPARLSGDVPAAHRARARSGGAVSWRRPWVGAAALLLTIVSASGDAEARFHLLRRLTKRALTHNVLSRERGGKPGTLVVLAHYDAAKTGWLFDPVGLGWRRRLGRRIGVEVGLFEPFTRSLLGLLALLPAVDRGLTPGAPARRPVASWRDATRPA